MKRLSLIFFLLSSILVSYAETFVYKGLKYEICDDFYLKVVGVDNLDEISNEGNIVLPNIITLGEIKDQVDANKYADPNDKDLDYKGFLIGKIGDNAFKDVKNINYIYAFDVTEVGKESFKNSSIKNFIAPNIEVIGEEAFANCNNLAGIFLSENLIHIGNKAFFNPELKILSFSDINNIVDNDGNKKVDLYNFVDYLKGQFGITTLEGKIFCCPLEQMDILRTVNPEIFGETLTIRSMSIGEESANYYFSEYNENCESGLRFMPNCAFSINRGEQMMLYFPRFVGFGGDSSKLAFTFNGVPMKGINKTLNLPGMGASYWFVETPPVEMDSFFTTGYNSGVEKITFPKGICTFHDISGRFLGKGNFDSFYIKLPVGTYIIGNSDGQNFKISK